jgi:protein-S-isoprenylcysteine O-methyltransferase Ste14
VAWFQIYKRQAKSAVVTDSHRLYLLSRDMAAISVVFAVVFPLGAIWSTTPWSLQLGYLIGLLVQYAMISTSSRNYGNRFVLNVLAEESQAK